jgi:hypothetical protein
MSTYYNKTIVDGFYGSFRADPDQANIPIYSRCKFVNAVSADGKACLQVAGITERADVVAMQPIVAGEWGTVKFLNGCGEQFAIATETITRGDELYSAASGQMSKSSGSSAVLCGRATSDATATNVFTYSPYAGQF